MLAKVLKSQIFNLTVVEEDTSISKSSILELSSELFELAGLSHGEEVSCYVVQTGLTIPLYVIKSKMSGYYCKTPSSCLRKDWSFNITATGYSSSPVEDHYPTSILCNTKGKHPTVKSIL